MTVEGRIRQLFEEIKYEKRFPPREAAERIKSEFSVKGLGRSGALVKKLSNLYVEAVESILDDFSGRVIARRAGLGLSTDGDLRQATAHAHEHLFNEARGLLLDELKGLSSDFQTPALDMIDERRTATWAHLERKIDLSKLDDPVARKKEEKEREQKFRILLSAPQAKRDFEDAVAEAKNWDNPVAFLFVDLDHFKPLNERWTHATVDETILPAVQKLLAKLVQGRGQAYRHGGEEFLLIMPNMDLRESEAFGEKVRGAFERQPFEVKGTPQRITVSVGLAIWPDHGATYQEVLEAANRAEVEAKQTRNSVKVASAGRKP